MTEVALLGITFDIGSTMLVPPSPGSLHDARARAWSTLLEEAGSAVAEDQIVETLVSVVEPVMAAWRANEQFTGPRATDFCLDRLGLTVPEPLRASLVDALEGASVDGAVLTPNLFETLTGLKDAGLRLGIISDTFITPGARWLGHLRRCGVGDLFDHWTFSDEVGAYKPSPVVFAHAAAGLGVHDPIRLAHVGDLRRTDVAGARQAGWWSVRYAGVDNDETDQPDADHVIKDHRELLGILGL